MKNTNEKKNFHSDKIKVLVLYNKLWHYRVPVFNLLAKKVDLDVAYVEGKKGANCLFGQIKLDSWTFGKFVVVKQNVRKLANNYDVVIALGHVSWIKYALLPFYPGRKYKLLFWSIGVSASYTKRYDEIKRYDFVRDFFYRKADGLIFYSDYPINKYIRKGFNREKIFVANNTVEVQQNCSITQEPRNSILFIGTLYRQKGAFDIVLSFHKIIVESSQDLHLEVVGDGPDFKILEDYVRINYLSKRVTLHGAIYEGEVKSKIFDRSLLVLSPFQSGLGVLESFGYGLPFVTFNNSFTGGERFNIRHGETGLLYDSSDSSLDDIFNDILSRNHDYLEMGRNAKKWYDTNRRPEQMAQSIYEAISSTVE